MSELISGKEALIALANGEEVEFEAPSLNKWICMKSEPWDLNIIIEDKYNHKFRLKPRTITLNGIEVPATFEPKEGDTVFIPVNFLQQGYMECKYPTFEGHCYQFGAWRTEDEIKQVVAALRKIFVINNQ